MAQMEMLSQQIKGCCEEHNQDVVFKSCIQLMQPLHQRNAEAHAKAFESEQKANAKYNEAKEALAKAERAMAEIAAKETMIAEHLESQSAESVVAMQIVKDKVQQHAQAKRVSQAMPSSPPTPTPQSVQK